MISKIMAGIACTVLVLCAGWRQYEYQWYAGIIPEHLGISYPVEIGGQSGLREGCGAAIFRMDEATAQKIIEQGARYLARSMVSRDHQDTYHTFLYWQETPVGSPRSNGGDGTLLSLGLDCGSIEPGLRSTIQAASRAPGAYYAYGPEKVLFVDPAARLIVLSYNG